jgi:predicted amidophosphoribosyltransferase
MKYGIESEGLKLKCGNCKNIIATDGELKTNYCDKCGAPLSVLAIADFEELKDNIRKSTVLTLKDYADKNHTDSFVEILKQYSKDAE